MKNKLILLIIYPFINSKSLWVEVKDGVKNTITTVKNTIQHMEEKIENKIEKKFYERNIIDINGVKHIKIDISPITYYLHENKIPFNEDILFENIKKLEKILPYTPLPSVEVALHPLNKEHFDLLIKFQLYATINKIHNYLIGFGLSYMIFTFYSSKKLIDLSINIIPAILIIAIFPVSHITSVYYNKYKYILYMSCLFLPIIYNVYKIYSEYNANHKMMLLTLNHSLTIRNILLLMFNIIWIGNGVCYILSPKHQYNKFQEGIYKVKIKHLNNDYYIPQNQINVLTY